MIAIEGFCKDCIFFVEYPIDAYPGYCTLYEEPTHYSSSCDEFTPEDMLESWEGDEA